MNKQYIVTFHTHYEALCCKRTLEQKILETQDAEKENSAVCSKHEKDNNCIQIAVKLIPVPRALSSSCGTALSVELKVASSEDVAFLFECEHDEIYTLDERGEYHLENEQQ